MKLPLNVFDLVPKRSKFNLSTRPGVDIWLEPWSLWHRELAISRYGGEEALNDIFAKVKTGPICEMIFEQLEDKSLYPDLKSLQKAALGFADIKALIDALTESIGIGEPEKKIIEEHLARTTKKIESAEGVKLPNDQAPQS